MSFPDWLILVILDTRKDALSSSKPGLGEQLTHGWYFVTTKGLLSPDIVGCSWAEMPSIHLVWLVLIYLSR